MKPSFLISVAAGLLLAGCGNNNSSPHPQGTNTSQTTNTTDSAHPAAPSGGYLGALMQADKYAVKTIDVSYLNEAVQLFNTQEGRLPKHLNELVPNYVGKLPATPYGTKLDYDPNTGQVKVVKQ
jgi:hypothetical protein